METGVELRAGSRWRSAGSTAEVIVVKPPNGLVDLRCGGVAMVPQGETVPEAAPPVDDGETVLGKRYEHEPTGLLVLCTKAGKGSLSIGDTPLTLQVTRALPSSD
jgi:hypothetical protein